MAIIDNGHWIFPEQLDYKKAHGFIYMIRRISTGQLYIGRKNFRQAGKLTKGRQSNWRSYTSSSKDVNALISLYGKSDFKFYVLEQYYTKGGVGWAETWSQCFAEVASNHERFMNRLIDKVCWKSTEKISDRHKMRLNKVLSL